MQVFITGGAGYIGQAVVRALISAGHTVTALARSAGSAVVLRGLGAEPVTGDMAIAGGWLDAVDRADGLIHLAAPFEGDMAAADRAFLDLVLPRLAARSVPARVVYTGGCWLYGAVGWETAVEGSPFDPLPDFAYMVAHRRRLFETPGIAASVVHPAMVWDAEGGALARFIDEAGQGQPPRVFGDPAVRWPLVHRNDLARLYVRALEAGCASPDRHGVDYHGVGEVGVPVMEIARAVARRYRAPDPVVVPVETAIAELGNWAAGLALDQTMAAPRSRRDLAWEPTQPGVLGTLSGIG